MKQLAALTAKLPAMAVVAGGLGISALPAKAQIAEPWQMGLQEAHSPVMERIASFHDLLMWVIVLITLFVTGLLIYVCYRFAEKSNPNPSKRTHSAMLEVIWTVTPVAILVIIAIPSFKLLYFTETIPETEVTVKAIGRQWYWSYEYPDEEAGFVYDSYMLRDDELEEGQPRLLATDNPMVVPAGVNVRLQVTASDVLHSFAMPALGLKIDAVPGRLNEGWFRVETPGIYYGQCSELCGVDHGFMPIELHALSREDYDAWIAQARDEFAAIDGRERAVVADAAQ